MAFDPTPGFNITRNAGTGVPFIDVNYNNRGNTGNFNDGRLNDILYGATGRATNQPAAAAPAPAGRQQSGIYNTPDPQAAQDARDKADLIGSLGDQEAQLRGLLGRTETGLNQGLSKLDSDYQSQVNGTNGKLAQARVGFDESRVDTTKGKQSTYDQINGKANKGYRSLAQIIGRAGGTNSSAFREALPDAVGTEVSGDRTVANDTYGQNMGRIQKAQGETESSFASILADLGRQRQAGEADLRSGIEGQRQELNDQLGSVARQRVQAQGGDWNAARQASAPYQGAIESSRNQVESFFNQFKPQIQAQAATVARPELGQFSVDRSDINAQQQGAQPGSNPYADMLRKKLQGQV